MNGEWAHVSLKDILARHTTKNTVDNQNVLTISARHGLVSQRDFFNKQVASKDLSRYFLLERGDFAYNKSYSGGYPVGAIKRLVHYATGVVSPLYICFRVKDEAQTNADFLAQYFEAGLLERGLRSIAKEGARNHGLLNVKPSEFFDLPMQLPPIAQQKKIATVLGSVDEAIEATRAVIEQLQVVKKAMMDELLRRGLPGRHTRFKQTDIGEVPEEWHVARIGECCSIRNDLRKPLNQAERSRMPGPYPYYGPTKKIDSIDEYRLAGEFALIGEDGDHFLKFARWSMTQLVSGKFNVNNHAHVVAGTRACCAAWFAAFFRHRDIVSKLTRQGATRYKLRKATLEEMLIPLPSIAEQENICATLSSIEVRLNAEHEVATNLAATKRSLASVLLTGEVRVKPDPEPA